MSQKKIEVGRMINSYTGRNVVALVEVRKGLRFGRDRRPLKDPQITCDEIVPRFGPFSE